MTRRIDLILLVLAAASIGPARADDPACAKYQDPLAYNACLASHGPKAKDLATIPHQSVGSAPTPVQAQRSAPARARSARSRPHFAHRRGRARMEFQVR
jgi:hypothetical protein